MSTLLRLVLMSLVLTLAKSARILEETTNAVLPPVVVPGPTVVANTANAPTLSLFMHDILGGSSPSVRVVAGMIASTQINGIPFSKPNGGVFPVSNGVPLVTPSNGVNNVKGMVNSGNLPFIAGLNGASTSTVINNIGNNNVVSAAGNSLPFVTAGQLPTQLHSLMFGTVTVIDDELTEEEELGSAVVGRAQGFYLASSLDGSSHTMAFTVLLHHGGGGHDDEHGYADDTISFFGVHRAAGLPSPIAVVGGTGKYEDARGHAVIDTPHLAHQQHTTDGVDTLLHLTVFLS